MWRKISFIFNVSSPEPDRIYEKRRRYDEYVVEKKHSAQLLGNKLKDLNCSNRAEEAKEIVKPGLLIIPPDDIVFVAIVQCPKSMQCFSEIWRIRRLPSERFVQVEFVTILKVCFFQNWLACLDFRHCIIAVEDHCDTYVMYVRNKRKQQPNFKQSKGRWQIFWEHFWWQCCIERTSLSITMRQVHRNVSICAKTRRNWKSSSN